jgi:hypothetical protein
MALTSEQFEQLIRGLKEAVDDFLATVDFFKTCEGITDNNAVKGLTLLLEGTAHTWWRGIKGSIFTWTEAQTAIRNEFAPSPPAFQVYQQVFASRQDDETPTGLVISEKRALLAQVNPPDTESRQIDFIYGLLRLEIRDRVPRKTIRDFTSLLDAAREVEVVMRERRSETTAETSKKVRVRCSYCGNKGHDITTCRKRETAEKSEKDSKPGEPVKVELRCYGCGKPGVIKRNCPLCSPHQDTTAAQTLAFHALSIEPTDEGNARMPEKRHQPNVMLDHYENLFEEHRATTPILKQADRPLVYTLRPDAGNHAIGAAPLQGEKPNRRKTRNMKPQLPGKPPPRRKPPPARKRSPPEDPHHTSAKPYVVPTHGFEGEVAAIQSCSAPSGHQSSALVASPTSNHFRNFPSTLLSHRPTL